MKIKSMGIVAAMIGAFGSPSYSHLNTINCAMSMGFGGSHHKKQNKLSQSAKRKRARQKGGKK